MIYLSLVQYVLHKFLVGICRIQYKKSCFFFKKSLAPLYSLCKFYYETDCYLFDKYKHKTSL